jgi:catechol 2,3-dioxygenase-like lactoylglutathione lyase family enzyme
MESRRGPCNVEKHNPRRLSQADRAQGASPLNAVLCRHRIGSTHSLFNRRRTLSRTGFIDHIGIGVPDLSAAKRYYDELMPILGLRQWFKTSPEGSFNYGPDGARGTQVFFYQALEADTYSRHRTGLQHLAFVVASRAIVREAYQWARARDSEILHEPKEFPEYGQHYATFWLDPHGFKLEVVCFNPEGVTGIPPASSHAQQ